MINVRLSQIYNNKPYYEIRKREKVCYALGVDQAIKVIRDIRRRKEKIEIRDINQILEGHDKLLELLK